MKTSLLTTFVVAAGLLPMTLRGAASSEPVMPAAAAAQQNTSDLDVVRVTHTGRAPVALAHVGLKASLVTKAPTAAAALEAHRKERERAVAGMRAAGVEVFDLEAGGLVVQLESMNPNQQFGGVVMVNGRLQEPDAPDRDFECRQELRFFVSPSEDPNTTADVLALAHDTAKQLGLELEPPADPYGRVMFDQNDKTPRTLVHRLADDAQAAAIAAAERDALDAARAQATRLVAWSGRALGPVRALQAAVPVVTWTGLGATAEVSVSVTVTFGLER